MAFDNGQVSIGSTATLIATADADGGMIHLHDDSANSIFVGKAGVLTTTGYEMDAGTQVSIKLGPNEPIYGVSAAGGDTLSWLLEDA